MSSTLPSCLLLLINIVSISYFHLALFYFFLLSFYPAYPITYLAFQTLVFYFNLLFFFLTPFSFPSCIHISLINDVSQLCIAQYPSDHCHAHLEALSTLHLARRFPPSLMSRPSPPSNSPDFTRRCLPLSTMPCLSHHINLSSFLLFFFFLHIPHRFAPPIHLHAATFACLRVLLLLC